jgi:hypothetical protein
MSIISLKNVRTTTKKPAMWIGRIFETGWQDEKEGGRRSRRRGRGEEKLTRGKSEILKLLRVPRGSVRGKM